jgi:hypothetical protein
MQTEIGLDVTCAVLVLLRGAITQIDQQALGCGDDDPEKQHWRARIFGYAYWVAPFGRLAEMKAGLTLRIQDLGGDELVPELERFINWIEDLQGDPPPVCLEDCHGIREEFFRPAFGACEKMSDGNLP